jgi:hypothetical protein
LSSLGCEIANLEM